MTKRKFILIILSLSFILVITGCSNDGDGLTGNGSGSISGCIECDDTNIELMGTEVWVIEENPAETDKDPEEFTIVKRITVDNLDGCFIINDIPEGTYYVAAYKDLNGNETLDIGEVAPDETGPIDAAGFYGDMQENVATPVSVEKDETTSDINISIMTAATPFDISGILLNITESTIENPPHFDTESVSMSIYGSEGIEIGTSSTSTIDGSFTFEDIYPGIYYITTEEITNYLPTCTFYYLFDAAVEIGDGLDIPLLEETTAVNLMEYTTGTPLVVGEVCEDPDLSSIGGAEVSFLTDDVSDNNKGYSDTESGGINFDLTSTADKDGLFVIKNGSPGNNIITADDGIHTFEGHELDLVNNWLTYGKVISSSE